MIRYFLVLLLAFCAIALIFLVSRAKFAAQASTGKPLDSPGSDIATTSAGIEASSRRSQNIRLGSDFVGAAVNIREQGASSTNYTIDLLVPGRDEQALNITAPPGGLQLEVRDMTGDNVRNDLLLRPALTHWPLMVLLNDGSNHFTVAISSSLTIFWNSENRASRRPQLPENLLLPARSSNADGLSACHRFHALNLYRDALPPLNEQLSNREERSILSGRAPPRLSSI